MNTRNTERNPPENKETSIKSEEDPFQMILAKLEQKDEDIHDLKLEILSLRDQVKGGNNSHTGPTYTIVHKVNIDLPRFDNENNRDGIRWINKIEKYFEINNIYSDDDKLNVGAMYKDKNACDWMLWWDSTMKEGRLVRD